MDALCRKIERQLGTPGARVSFLTNDAADIAAIAKLRVDVYCKREPMTRQLVQCHPTLVRESLMALSVETARRHAKQGFSPIVKVNGKLVCFVLMGPYEPPPSPSEAPPGLEPVFDLLSKLTEKFDAYVATRKDQPKFFEFVTCAVDDGFQGRQMLLLITQLAIAKATKMGFTDIVGKAASNSQGIAEKTGLRTIGEVSYLTHEYAGKRHFAHLEPREARQAKVVTMDLQAFRQAQQRRVHTQGHYEMHQAKL
ncbi:hypothetical protein BC834DRAFT_858630 [Gloeopeniophorella convolvens]|nr:hypothetical protein BC834DRAFT_858630 [Gloeopeniophorella convolvens]